VLAKARAKPNFGNGGAVDTLLSQAVQRKQSRDGVGSCLELEDFGVTREGPDNVTLDSLFDGLVGMTEIKARLQDLRELINFATDRGEKIDKHASFNYLFLGNPGTGKTTVANLMGKMFHSLGLLADDTVYVKTPKDFTTGYLGQAGIQTRDILQSCRGGVLFIDEAYQLNPANGNSYMKEVLDELCAALTEEEFQGKILVVLAGYTTDMEEMLDANPGLQSRFTGRMPFRDLDKGSIVELIKLRHSGEGKIPLSATVSEGDLHGIAKRLAEVPKFSNGRDVDTLCSFAYQEVAKRVYGGTGESEVGTKDLELALLHLCRDRNMGGAARTPNAVVPMLLPSAAGGPPRSQIRSTTQVATDEGVASPEEEAVETSGDIDSEISNPFGQFDPSMLLRIQDVLSDMGLNSEIGVRSVASLDPTSDRFLQLVRTLVEKAGISQDAATQVLIEWQRALSAAEKQKKKAKAALRLRAVEAIWHCAACGRGGNPVPVCYVAPFISGYRKRTA
jgi:AAA+ superfamily predicted ATPase